MELQGITVLEPPSKEQTRTDQWVGLVTFTGASQRPSSANDERCSIHTKLFSFVPAETPNQWTVKSPSAQGWTVSSTEDQLAADWMQLLAGLARLEQLGCFPAPETTYSIQRAIVDAIPIPSDQALLFYYSLTGSGYVDLQPGLEIRIEQTNASVDNKIPRREAFSSYKAVSRPGTGVVLQLSAPSSKKAQRSAPYPELSQTFASDRFLRLFLQQGATDGSKPREAMLLGASDSGVLNNATAIVLRDGPVACEAVEPGSSCVVLSKSGVSLLSTVTVNGHVTSHGPGTTLGQLLDALPDDAKKRALATVSVERSLSSGYAALVFQRELEAAYKVILVNGDRIRWAK